MFTHKNLMTVCCAAVLAFGLAACGSSSSSSDGKRAATVTDDNGNNGNNGNGENCPPKCKTDAEILAEALAAEATAQEAYDALVADAMADPTELGAAFQTLNAATADVVTAEALPGNQATLATAKIVAGAIVRDADGESAVIVYGTDTAFTVDGGKITERTVDGDADNNYAAVTDGKVAEITDWPDWPGSMSMATRMVDDEQVTHTVVSYTDRAPNAAALYSEYYGADVLEGHIARRGVTTVNGLVLTLRDVVDVDSRPLFGDTDFGITARNQNLMVVDDGTTMDVKENEIEGMFHGIPGTFTCDGTCRVESDDKAMLSLLFGTWTFEPAEQATGADPYMVAGVAEDDFYLDFGYWIVEGPDDTYTVGTYARASDDNPYSGVGGVIGSADYAGPATGLYMRKRVDADGNPTSATSGQFTALAKLTATFGQTPEGDILPNLLDSITGTVGDFKDVYGNPIDAKWVVELMKGDIIDAGTFTGDTTGGGSYSGTFHGENDPDTTDAEKPRAATGVFDAHFDNGHAAGAFGANLVEEME